MFSPEQAQALMFSLGPAQALMFSLGPAQAPDHADAELPAERRAERVFVLGRGAAPERAGAGLRAAPVPGEVPFSLGPEEIWPVGAALRVWTPLDPAFSRVRLARTLLRLRRPPMTTVQN
jgi:hypothetical protein